MATIETIQSRGKKRFRAKIRIRGHRAVSRTFDRKTDARRWADQTETEIRNGQFFKTYSVEKKTVADMIDKYLTEELPRLNQKDRSKINRLMWWRRKIGYMRLSQISRADIKSCQDALLSELLPNGQTRKSPTVNRYMSSFSHVYSYAVKEWEWVDESPMSKVRKLKESKGRDRVFSDAEIKALLIACQKSEEPALYPIALLALATGARQGELRKLLWSDISFSNRTVRFRDTKTADDRLVPLSEEPLRALQAYGKVRPLQDDSFVFPNPKGDKPINRNLLYNHWKQALADAGINDKEAVFHTTRHTALTNLARNGVHLTQIASIAGHKSIQTTMIYAHAQMDEKRQAIEQMNSQLLIQ